MVGCLLSEQHGGLQRKGRDEGVLHELLQVEALLLVRCEAPLDEVLQVLR